ncbi:MAG: DUF1344 domain-containing protein [Candidatus Methylomirabilis oxyfera]|nr:DUF1344 domain-containing protein [Candidatus Methylomirabilis oxyfera]
MDGRAFSTEREVTTMNRVWVSVMAMLIGLSLTTLAFGEQPGEPGKSPAPVEKKSEASKEAVGEVVKADPTKMTLVIKAAGRQLNFSVAEQAVSTLLTLKPGDKVMVQYTEINGKRTVQDIKKG